MRFLWAFLVGGLICVIGQVLIDKTRLTPAKILVGYVITGVVLGAFGVYDRLVDFAGSGARVPLSGFGNLLAAGTREAVTEQGLLGAFSGPLTAGAAGVMAAVLAGLVVSFFTKPKPR
ncbi:MAG: stage V sporulation protein AE [Clostridia bacterium]|nr:stage V sporulation protein AE [Clostridia bacterium]MBQ9507709.1 stage V sporulation protein AE [Clostridia bacterium]MBR5422394.1 stage V sporulation protein AE [Clostridia bacterium]